MIKSFGIKNEDLESNIFPNYYLFKQKIKNFSLRKDITSFSLGDKDVLEVLTDGEHAGQKFVQSGALFIKNSCVKRYSVNEFDGFYISHEKNNLLKRSKLKKDDILFTTIGYYVGVSALVNSNVENANINQNVVRIRVNPKITTPQYLSCFLNSKIVRFQIDNLFSGNIYPLLTYPKIKALKIFIKDKKVEKAVTEKIILAEEKNIESLKLIKEAQSLFTKSLGVDFAAIKASKFYGVNNKQFQGDDMMTPAFYYPLYTNTTKIIAENNHCEPLGTLADFRNGDEVGSVNYKSYLNRKEGDLPFIRTSDLVNYDFDPYPDFFIEKSIYDELGQNLDKDEILFTKDGKIGISAMTTKYDRCILGSGILRIVPKKDKINPHYLFIALSTKEVGIYQAIQRTVVASTMPHLREDRIGDFSIPILKNQKKIIELTEAAFKLRDDRKKLITDSRLLIEQSLEV
jgi:type I restriction enzyme S subunit